MLGGRHLAFVALFVAFLAQPSYGFFALSPSRRPHNSQRGRVFMQLKGDVLRNNEKEDDGEKQSEGVAAASPSWQSTMSQQGEYYLIPKRSHSTFASVSN